jgi:hypothetical protein
MGQFQRLDLGEIHEKTRQKGQKTRPENTAKGQKTTTKKSPTFFLEFLEVVHHGFGRTGNVQLRRLDFLDDFLVNVLADLIGSLHQLVLLVLQLDLVILSLHQEHFLRILNFSPLNTDGSSDSNATVKRREYSGRKIILAGTLRTVRKDFRVCFSYLFLRILVKISRNSGQNRGKLRKSWPKNAAYWYVA